MHLTLCVPSSGIKGGDSALVLARPDLQHQLFSTAGALILYSYVGFLFSPLSHLLGACCVSSLAALLRKTRSLQLPIAACQKWLGQKTALLPPVLQKQPNSPSGYYWKRATDGSAARVYCDMTRSCGGVTGGWMRVAELDMTNSKSRCPRGLRLRTDSNKRTCGIDSSSPGCISITFPLQSLGYSKLYHG